MKKTFAVLVLTLSLCSASIRAEMPGKAPPELTGYGLALKDFKKILEIVDNKAKFPPHSHVAFLTVRTDKLEPLVAGHMKRGSEIEFGIVGNIGRRPGKPLPRNTVPSPLRVEKQCAWLKASVKQGDVTMVFKLIPRYVFLDSKSERIGLAGALIVRADATGDLAKNLPKLGQDRWRAALRPLIQRVLQASLRELL